MPSEPYTHTREEAETLVEESILKNGYDSVLYNSDDIVFEPLWDESENLRLV